MHLKPSAVNLRAGRTLNEIPDSPKKLMLIYGGVAFGVNFLLMAISFYIDSQIANMGGLSAMGQQAVWSTVQAVLELVVLIFLPLWQIGLVFVALKWSRGENATTDDLWQGVRRIGAVLRLRLLEMVMFAVLAMVVGYAASTLYLLTPFSEELLEAIEPFMAQMENPMQTELEITPEMIEQFLDKGLPFLILYGVLYCGALVFLFYRIRLADYGVMEGKGAFRSLIDSFRYTNRNTMQLVRVDFFFWWFYLLQVACYVLQMGDILLGMAGVNLPFSADIAYFLFYILGGLAQLVLIWQCQGRISTAYAFVYRELEQKKSSPTV